MDVPAELKRISKRLQKTSKDDRQDVLIQWLREMDQKYGVDGAAWAYDVVTIHDTRGYEDSAMSKEVLGAKERTWRLLAKLGFVLGILLVVGGIIVAIIGVQGDTSISVLGAEITTTNVGIGMAGLGVVLSVLTARIILKSVDKTSK
ncbi:MAG: hypothetical protein IH991_06695 [Planctomycetes bacterium]|nr:hypothetical protein [Planctomycetota bacterium]